MHSLSIGSHPPTSQHTQPQQENLSAVSLLQPSSPEMMTHSLGPHVCTFPMALAACPSLKREEAFATSEEKTASPVGPSVTVSRFGLAMEECGLTSLGREGRLYRLSTGRESADTASQKCATGSAVSSQESVFFATLPSKSFGIE